jgi:mannose-6-phosphate isomerase-like protein (cupin superfamily)
MTLDMKRLIANKRTIDKVNLDELFGRFYSTYEPHLAGTFNGQQVRLMKFTGPLDWQRFEKDDILYHVFFGKMVIQMTKKNVELQAGDSMIIPRKLRHRPVAPEQVYLVIIQPKTPEGK